MKICPIMSAPGLVDAKHLGGDIGTVSHYNNAIVFQPCVGSECALWAPWPAPEGAPKGKCSLGSNSAPVAVTDPAHKEATE